MKSRRNLPLYLVPAFLIVSNLATSIPAHGISHRTFITPGGVALDDLFGYSVGTAGDVNGDGFADVIVGAYLNDAGGSEAGRAYVYYGGPGADTTPDLTLTGAGNGDLFGYSVGTAGDVNGDGYADVIVGAYQNDAGGGDAGRAYVFYGGPGADATADLTLTGEGSFDNFGESVGTAGDVNGDGYADVIVGADLNDAGSLNAGRAYVYYGGPGADAIADLTLTGAASGDLFGASVGTAGDVNGDGYADVIVGADLNDAGGINAGRAYVFYGGPGADTTADLTLTGADIGDQFGISVGAAGDVNADGYADVIVGANHNDAGGVAAGRAYVYYGGPGADAIADLTLTGAAASDEFGISVGTAGDVNRDGYADVLVGADLNDAGGSNAGRAYVYFGGPGADATADLTLTPPSSGGHFGNSVGTAGDVDGDGHADFIVGSPYGYAGGVQSGQAFVYSAYAYQVLSPNGGEQWVAGESVILRWLGHDVADLAISLDSGTSWNTLAVSIGGAEENERAILAPSSPTSFALVRLAYTGEPSAAHNSDASDAVFHIVQPVPVRAVASRELLAPTGAAVLDLFGNSVGTAGDVNGDRFDDFIVGAYQNDAGGAEAGRAYLYYGGPGADAIADLTLTGAATGDKFGVSVGTAGDVNGDGYADVVVGANFNDAGGAEAGRAYVYYGGPGADAIADLTLTGAASGDLFGASVGTAGDVNRDGYADVIVGADLNDAGGADAGRAYLYYGGPVADALVADLTMTGAAAGDGFGRMVGTAGDVNGDGYADVIVGASGNDAGGTSAGRAYLYFGGPSADATADLTLTGAAAFDGFGSSVGTAGDVNGDGYADVIVGAGGNDAGGSNAGRAYVYFGGPGADAVADLTLTGAAAGDGFGPSGAAGDVNGDGYADVIVGAFGNDAGGINAGRAYVYYGGPGADATADLILTGAAAFDSFGGSLGTAGDVTGDGHADVIVGANGNDAGGNSAGRAYVYDMNRYHLTSPGSGGVWNVGASRTITWLGAEPADLWLSVDGGASYAQLASGVGGSVANAYPLAVPHQPTKFAQVKVTPSDVTVEGFDRSDSLFTIQSSVALLAFEIEGAPAGAPGVLLRWETDPGPVDLAGYRLERGGLTGTGWTTLASVTRETSFLDEGGGAHDRYRLYAVNGLGEHLLVGETPGSPMRALSGWPLPYRGGSLNVSFLAASLGGIPVDTEVGLYDVGGRRVRRIAGGRLAAGMHLATWDGTDERGAPVAAGMYFLRVMSGGFESSLKVTVAR